MIVENKPGGAGNVAMQDVARAEADGHTLILGHVGTLAVNPYMFPKLPYDVDKDFVPVSLLAKVPNIFVVSSSVPAKDLKEFIALAKAKPGQLTYGSAGNGSAGHLAFEYLKLVTDIDVTHVPYKGTGPQITDLIGGRTDASSAGTPPLLPHVKSGKVRAIAVGMPQRIAVLPEVATVAEQGYAGFETSQWYGFERAGEDTRCGDQAPACRGGESAKVASGHRAIRGRQRDRDRIDAGGIHGVHPPGAGALERCRQEGEDQGGIARTLDYHGRFDPHFRRSGPRRRQCRAMRGDHCSTGAFPYREKTPPARSGAD